MVGRDYHRKGVDIALDVVELLNEMGQAAEMTVCGLSGPQSRYVKFVGPYRKSLPNELSEYVTLYRSAHILLHPARFEAAGIVPSEAAAFATPTVTNETGGLGTTVKNGVSGIVLSGGSQATDYANAIVGLISDRERYYSLCETTRARYEAELNWGVGGACVAGLLREMVSDSGRKKRVVR